MRRSTETAIFACKIGCKIALRELYSMHNVNWYNNGMQMYSNIRISSSKEVIVIEVSCAHTNVLSSELKPTHVHYYMINGVHARL